jgi:predicted kinase
MKPLNLAAPHLIVMVGIPGSGKSFFAEHFASTFNAPYVSFEKIRDELFKSQAGDNDQQVVVSRASSLLLSELLKTGQTIVYEGLTDAASVRQEIAKIARSKNYEPLFVWVQTESLSAKERVTKTIRGKFSMTVDQFEARLRRFTPPNSSEKAVVISGKHTYPSQLKIVLKRLAEGRVDKVELQTPIRSGIEGRRIAIR